MCVQKCSSSISPEHSYAAKKTDYIFWWNFKYEIDRFVHFELNIFTLSERNQPLEETIDGKFIVNENLKDFSERNAGKLLCLHFSKNADFA